MSKSKEGNLKNKIFFFFPTKYLGWLKIKLQNNSRWHRRYCIIDWDKAVLFLASKPDTRYKEWIKLASDIIINEYDYSLPNETNLNNSHNQISVNSIEIKVDSMIK